MTGMNDVIACVDIVYRKHFDIVIHRKVPFLIKFISRVQVLRLM